jgi:hypothetical protein
MVNKMVMENIQGLMVELEMEFGKMEKELNGLKNEKIYIKFI